MNNTLFHNRVSSLETGAGLSETMADTARIYRLDKADQIDGVALGMLGEATYIQMSPRLIVEIDETKIGLIVSVHESSMWTLYVGFPGRPAMPLADYIHGVEDDADFEISTLERKRLDCVLAAERLAAACPLYLVQHNETRTIRSRSCIGIDEEIYSGKQAPQVYSPRSAIQQSPPEQA